jgi:hypothetical protein
VRVGFGIGFVPGPVDYYHDHRLDCGCTVPCQYKRGAHHYRHDHGGRGRYGYYDGRDYGSGRYDSRRYDYGNDPYSARDRDYFERDRYRDRSRYERDSYYSDGDSCYRSDYRHDHYLGRGRYRRCHVRGGVHYPD